MVKTKLGLLLIVSSTALSACAGSALKSASRLSVSGEDQYQKTLYSEYISLSEAEYAEGDYDDSDFFANRAKIVAGGKIIPPEKIENRKLPSEKVDELRNARENFIKTYEAGASRYEPVALAKAHASFDCWIQEQEENFQPKDIAACRDGYFQAMQKVEDAKPKPEKQLYALKQRVVQVYFGHDQYELNNEAQSTVAEIANILRKNDELKVSIKGYTDTTGSESHNNVLAQKRMNSVVNALSSYNIVQPRITAVSYGEHQLAIPTEDNVVEPKNRRAEIIFDVYEPQ